MSKQRSYNILIVDDEPKITKIISQYLSIYNGFDKIVIASSVMQATQKMANQEFDLIITDLSMGKVGGGKLIDTTRKHPKYYKIKFIVVSGFLSKDSTIEIIKKGVRHIVVKPFTVRQILESVFEVLKIDRKPHRLATETILQLANSLNNQRELILRERRTTSKEVDNQES